MLNKDIILTFEIQNKSAHIETVRLADEFVYIPADEKRTITIATSAGETHPFSIELQDATPEILFQVAIHTDDAHLQVENSNGWEVAELLDGSVSIFDCSYSDEALIVHHFRIPVKPPIGIVIVGTTDPVKP
jgi:hypothetical protein